MCREFSPPQGHPFSPSLGSCSGSLFPPSAAVLTLTRQCHSSPALFVTMELALRGRSGISITQTRLQAAFSAWHSPVLALG